MQVDLPAHTNDSSKGIESGNIEVDGYGQYEAAIDSQVEDAQKMQIEKCAYRNCGFLFVDIQFHYWQYHPQHIRPNTNQAGMIDKKDTEDKLQEVQVPCQKSD